MPRVLTVGTTANNTAFRYIAARNSPNGPPQQAAQTRRTLDMAARNSSPRPVKVDMGAPKIPKSIATRGQQWDTEQLNLFRSAEMPAAEEKTNSWWRPLSPPNRTSARRRRCQGTRCSRVRTHRLVDGP